METPTRPEPKVLFVNLFLASGSGTYGKVVRAVHITTGESFAIKIIAKASLRPSESSPLDTAMLERELNITRQIRHPNVIHLEDWFETSSKVYLVFQL